MNLRKILIPLLFTALPGITAQAQQRSCEMAVSLLSPAEGTVIGAFAQYNVTVRITNNGLDNLVTGDTVYYNTPMMPVFNYLPYILQADIPAGQTADVTLTTPTNTNQNSVDEVVSYCVRVISNPQGNGSFIDPNQDETSNNNTDCNQVTLKATPTGIQDAVHQKEKLELYPNPANARLHLKFETDKTTEVTAVIRDIAGREIALQYFGKVKPGASATLSLEVGSLVPGIYLVELRSEGRKATGKFVKE